MICLVIYSLILAVGVVGYCGLPAALHAGLLVGLLHLLAAHRRRRSIANGAAVLDSAARARLRRERRLRELLGVAPRRDVYDVNRWRAP